MADVRVKVPNVVIVDSNPLKWTTPLAVKVSVPPGMTEPSGQVVGVTTMLAVTPWNAKVEGDADA
ncbi:MAG TPA: hypothetical protein VK126_00155 [Nitrososphaerales archaeon]|nr:hypothetical protein [Nitrososphaerales archaeon]